MSYLSIKDWKVRQIQGSRNTESTANITSKQWSISG